MSDLDAQYINSNIAVEISADKSSDSEIFGVESAVVKCGDCGADMFYDPDIAKLSCPFCNGTRAVEKRMPMLRDFISERGFGEAVAADTAYVCPNCGAESVLKFQTAVKCPYCGATNIVKKESLKGLKPDSILPFALSKNRAQEFGKKWLKRKLFAPYGLKKDFKADKFKGLYFPSFVFFSNSHSVYEGRLGEEHTRTVGSGKDRHTETYMVWYNVRGDWRETFRDIVVEASEEISQKDLSKILPYDMTPVESYNREYVAGFSAERYNNSLDNSFGIAKQGMDNIIKRNIINHYSADAVDYMNINTTYNDIKFRYAMLPLWICRYKYKNKDYRFIVNGRTGRSYGKTPVSPWRITVTVLLSLGLMALFIWLFAFSGIINV